MSQAVPRIPSSRSHGPRKGAVRFRSQSALARQRRALRRKFAADHAPPYGSLSAWERYFTMGLTVLIGVELLQAMCR